LIVGLSLTVATSAVAGFACWCQVVEAIVAAELNGDDVICLGGWFAAVGAGGVPG
jgi:hypothetical protein